MLSPLPAQLHLQPPVPPHKFSVPGLEAAVSPRLGCSLQGKRVETLSCTVLGCQYFSLLPDLGNGQKN